MIRSTYPDLNFKICSCDNDFPLSMGESLYEGQPAVFACETCGDVSICWLGDRQVHVNIIRRGES